MKKNNGTEAPVCKKPRMSRKGSTKCIVSSDNNCEELNSDKTLKPVKSVKHLPKFRFKIAGEQASLETINVERVPLVLTDIQHLLLHSLLGSLNLSQPPRWYVLEKCGKITQTTCLILEGVSVKHLQNYYEDLTCLKTIFNHTVEVLTPSVYNGSLVQELALVPLTELEKESLIQKYGSMNLALEVRKDLMVMMRAIFPIVDQSESTNEIRCNDKFPRTQLILSAWQLLEENYPVPLKGKLQHTYSDYVMSKEEYTPVTATSPLFGIDCEMCITNAGSELTRISVVNEKHEVVYESLVKPYNDITDYLTRFSGITKPILNDVTKRLEDVQKDLRELLPSDAILVGQSLNVDMHALKMMHPYIIDTSVIFNFMGERSRKPKLKSLVKELLREDIQCGKNGHCSVEDSLASLKLVQLKLSKNIEYGDAVHTNREKFKENIIKMAQSEHYTISIFNRMMEHKKSSLIVGCDNITGDYHTYLSQAKENMTSQLKRGKGMSKKIKLNTVDTVDEVISTLCNAVSEYNFTMAHLRLKLDTSNELEEIKKIDKWIKSVWNSVEQSALCIVVLGGTTVDNGVAMIRVKGS